MANTTARSPLPYILEDEKLLFSDVNSEDKAEEKLPDSNANSSKLYGDGPICHANTPLIEPANPSVELGGSIWLSRILQPKISFLIVMNCNDALVLLTSSLFYNEIFPFCFMNDAFSYYLHCLPPTFSHS